MESPERSPNPISRFFIERTPRFYRSLAYCIIVVAIAATIIILVSVDHSTKLCYPPEGRGDGGISKASSSSENVTLRIVGGARAGANEYPYLVSLQHDGKHFCGGSLIRKRHVLTAAHCLHTFRNKIITVLAGTNQLKSGLRYDVERSAIHPDFSLQTTKADVGVIKLREEVELSANVSLIQLPKRGVSYLHHGLELNAAGYGKFRRDKDAPASDYLKKLTIYACSRQICEFHYGNVREKGQFCAILEEGSGLCQGDSGGPITIDKRIVIGIATGVHGLAGCAGGFPDVLTYVPFFLDFIDEELTK